MADLVLHPITRRALEQLIAQPSHAVIVEGPRGAGKGSVARYVAASLLRVNTDKLANQPYMRSITAATTAEASISIDAVRELEHFLSRKTPGAARRVVLIEDAHTLTLEAQNALLKTLEEPPEDSIIIMTVDGEQNLLPTVRSRATLLHVIRPSQAVLTEYFGKQGYRPEAVNKNVLLAGGLPGLLAALLAEDTVHPLAAATLTARDIMQKSLFERLCLVDTLAKQKPLCTDTLHILQRMAHVALSAPQPSLRWRQVLEQAYIADEQLRANAQPKLVLTNLMLNL